nr:MAG TPA: hypothetical protein [Caudoviricetes sp.]
MHHIKNTVAKISSSNFMSNVLRVLILGDTSCL